MEPISQRVRGGLVVALLVPVRHEQSAVRSEWERLPAAQDARLGKEDFTCAAGMASVLWRVLNIGKMAGSGVIPFMILVIGCTCTGFPLELSRIRSGGLNYKLVLKHVRRALPNWWLCFSRAPVTRWP